MNSLLAILASVGLDQTTGVQFVLFSIIYLFLYFLIFKPYFNAYLERQKRTEGSKESAGQLLDEVKNLETEYKEKAKKYNLEYKTVFDQVRNEALQEHDQVIAQAREESKIIIDEANKKVATEVELARKSLQSESSNLSQLIVEKLAGKEAAL